MKQCDLCGEHEACVVVKQMDEGQIRELSVCQDCADLCEVNVPAKLIDLLLEGTKVLVGADEETEPHTRPEHEQGGGESRCPACRMRVSHFRKTGRLGCATCYETWQGLVDPMLFGMHRSLQYMGKAPQEPAVDPARLRGKLALAIADEDYEQAAVLRDRLRAMEQMVVAQQEEFTF